MEFKISKQRYLELLRAETCYKIANSDPYSKHHDVNLDYWGSALDDEEKLLQINRHARSLQS